MANNQRVPTVVQLPRSPIELDAFEPVSDRDPDILVENSATQAA